MPFIVGVVLGLLHTSAAATRDARASCVSGSVEGTPLTIATHDPASTRCRDSSEENQPSVPPSLCVQSSNKEDALDFFRVNNESTDYHASSFTLTEGATFYLDVEGHLEVIADESCGQRAAAFPPPFCAGANAADVDRSCDCWCPRGHGRADDTGLCVLGGEMSAAKADGSQDGKTNVGGDGAGPDGDGGISDDGDGGEPPATSKSSAILIIGILAPLLVLAGIAGYVIAARKKEQTRQQEHDGSVDDTYVEPVPISDQNQNGPNQYADMGIDANGPGAVPPTLDAGDPYDMPNDFNQQGVRISGTAASTSAAAGTGAPIDDPYDMPNDFNQQGVRIDQASVPMYDTNNGMVPTQGRPSDDAHMYDRSQHSSL